MRNRNDVADVLGTLAFTGCMLALSSVCVVVALGLSLGIMLLLGVQDGIQ